MRVKFNDRVLWQSYLKIVGIISSFVTLVSFFISIQEYENWIKIALFVVFCLILIMTFLVMWWKANTKKEVKLKINHTNVEIKIGDILKIDGSDELSVINVNEYFDMEADDHLVAKLSLHGQYIEKIQQEGKWDALNTYIEEDNIYNFGKDYEINPMRKYGKNVRHPIGSMIRYESYILTAFAKVDEKEQAYLSGEDYVGFLMRFWSNLGSIYAGRTINIPVMGAGITRFQDGKPSNQTLLEMILWSLKISGFSNSYSDQKVNIIIYEPDANEIDFYHIQHNPNYK